MMWIYMKYVIQLTYFNGQINSTKKVIYGSKHIQGAFCSPFVSPMTVLSRCDNEQKGDVI